ncbi:MAG: hypothetical protein QM621_05955, partial [Aeromicrobium sp.]|uniref:hypothetical protein n=1 Tax=Aeromicrobium sp. TaxID=1871063 RepID=UPI0039E63A23
MPTSRTRRLAPLSLAVALVGASLVMVVGAAVAPAAAVAGNPGTPSAPTLVWNEDFENGLDDGEIATLTGATSSGGVTTEQYRSAFQVGEPPAPLTYTSSVYWASTNQGNGIVLDYLTENATLSGVGVPGSGPGVLRNLALRLGTLRTPGDETAAQKNHAVAAYSNSGSPGANSIQFETEELIPLTQQNRFLTFSADVAAANCNTHNDPYRNYYFLDEAGSEYKLNDAVLNACNTGETTQVRASTVVGTRAMLLTGGSVGLRIRNVQDTSSGNDAAFDNIEILDVTPQLDKEFVSGSGVPGTEAR